MRYLTIRYLVAITAFCLLTACQQSPQKRYYVLSAYGPATTAATTTNTDQTINSLIGIGPIELADYLKRPNMVRMRTNNTLNLTANDYWAEPLDKGILRILALRLTQYDSSRMIQPFPWRSDSTPSYSLRLQIHELALTDSQAMINATWELVDTTNKQSIKRQHFIRSINAGSSAKTMAEAYSQLISQLAEVMNNALKEIE